MSGDAEPGSPVVGRNASYIMSSLPKNGVNTYSFVHGLQGIPGDGFHDCSSQSKTAMPSTWACISFEVDSVARKLRMYKDGAADPILSVDEHGKGCVAPTAVDSPWYGPAVTQALRRRLELSCDERAARRVDRRSGGGHQAGALRPDDLAVRPGGTTADHGERQSR